MAKQTNENKGYYWEIIIYPDSAPKDWKKKIIQLGLPGFFSMLHDQDKYDEDDPERGIKKGDLKKPHYHVVLCWRSSTTRKNVFSIAESLNTTRVIRVQSVTGRYDYMCHPEDLYPDKYHYADQNESFNGFSYTDYKVISKGEGRELRIDIIRAIRQFELTEYFELVDLLTESEEFEMLDYVWTHTIAFKAYLEGRRYKGYKNKSV